MVLVCEAVRVNMVANGRGLGCGKIVWFWEIGGKGWGTGWAAGNAVRFNTDACLGPMWVVRTVLSGQGTVEDDQFKLQIRGDAD